MTELYKDGLRNSAQEMRDLKMNQPIPYSGMKNDQLNVLVR